MKTGPWVAALFGALLSAASSAAIIDNGSYTSDTALGIDYLDVGLLSNSYGDYQSGVVHDGRLWHLATSSQLASTWSAVTGLSLTTSAILSSDNDMGSAATALLIDLFDGVTSDVGESGERVIGDYNSSGYYNFIDGGSLAVHSIFDDSHFSDSTAGSRGAWLVSARQPSAVPEPASLALLGLGLAGLCGLRRKN